MGRDNMTEKLLTPNQASEFLGVTVKTLKEWDYSEYFKPTLYTEGGHRRYSQEDLEDFLKRGHKTKFTQETMDKTIMSIMSAYSRGVLQLVELMEDGKTRERCDDFPSIWKKASVQLLELSEAHGIDGFKFPLTINEQFKLLAIPLHTWEIRYFDKLFNKSSNDEPILYHYGITDYCRELAELNGDDPEEVIEFKAILDETRHNNETEIYTKIRRFVIENPVISNDDLDFQLLSIFTGEASKYRLRIHNLYEEIPQEYIQSDGYFYKCPYCGWTLKRSLSPISTLSPEEAYKFKCNTDKCRFHTTEWYLGEHILSKGYLRVKPGIQKYIVEPGIVELVLYKKIYKLFDEAHVDGADKMVVLYPNCDYADISITFKNGVQWIIDVKDWKLPQALAMKLNEKELFSGLNYINFDRGLLVIPESYEKDYISSLKVRWNESDKYEVLKVNQLIKEIKEGLGVIR